MGIKRGDVFSSAFFKSSDLDDGELMLVIESCAIELVGQGSDADNRAVVRFKDCDQGLALNATNWDRLEDAYGKDSDEWVGECVILYSEPTRFQGKAVKGIRVKPQKGGATS